MNRNIEQLNNKYKLLEPEARIRELYNDFDKVLLTSSFGITSALLLHMITKVRPAQPIHFLDTTYHFSETLAYRDQLKERLKLQLQVVRPDEWKNRFTATDETWKKDPDLCCSINKVEPLDKLKSNYEVWVSGLMSSQNAYRRQLQIFEKKGGIIKFYPVIDMQAEEVDRYLKENGLPHHPLKARGFNSVGCRHCTVKGKAREGRWANLAKTECGLHA